MTDEARPGPRGGRPRQRSVRVRALADGTRIFELRFRAYGERQSITLHERPSCDCGCGGGWSERAARRELADILARVGAGIWKCETPTRVEPAPPVQGPTFHEYASQWLQRRSDGVLGDRPLSRNSRADYRGRLRNHLLPFFGNHRLDEIDTEMCIAFKAEKIREARQLEADLAAGADLRDAYNRRRVPLGPASIRKLIDALTAILDDAIEDGHIERNPARTKRMRVRVPKPARTFLEADELRALIDAAEAQDVPTGRITPPPGAGAIAQQVAERLNGGMSQQHIAAELGRTKATINWHARRMSVAAVRYSGSAFIVRVLGYSGVRNSELCDLLIGQVRLHDPAGARFHIPDAKTETGIRVVEMSPKLAAAFTAHLERLRQAGHSTGLDDHVIQNTRGGRVTRQRVAAIIREAAVAANEAREREGLPLLPRTTPHSLRRTYISIALRANNYDVKFVMAQVGHADSKMTLDVYAQLEHRAKRDHGRRFDELIDDDEGQRDRDDDSEARGEGEESSEDET
jgi:integrase